MARITADPAQGRQAKRGRQGSHGTQRPLGRREQNKRDKLARIIVAARQLFTKKGFDATRISDIARRAKVAEGTVFIYAQDKRDLIFLAVNDEFEAVTNYAFVSVPLRAPLLDQLTELFRHYYIFYNRNQGLAHILLREIFFFGIGRQAARTKDAVSSTLVRLTAVIGAAQKTGEIRTTEDASQIARLLYSIYQIEVRRWVDNEPLDVDEGVATLRKMLALALRGSAVHLR
jgi:AcrR family transcriptional regulator